MSARHRPSGSAFKYRRRPNMTVMRLAWWSCVCTVAALYVGVVGAAGAVSASNSAVAPKCGTRACAHGTCDNDTCVCADGWQGPDCLHCGGKIRLVEPVGFIHDGPGNYSVSVKCSWLIEAARLPNGDPANATIRLHLEEFATECGWDHLYIYDGDSVDSPLLAVFSGLMYKDSYAVRSVPEVMTRSGSALLHFFSDDAYNMSGFNISYAINACPSRYSSVNCSGNGICEDSVCKCHSEWTGKACDRPKCPGNCSYSLQQGMCSSQTQSCQCHAGFGGHDCSQPVVYGVWESVEVGSFKPAGSASHGATVWRDSLYIVSGESYGRSHLMYTYDFNGGVWETPHFSNVVPNPRYGASAVIHGDKIYLYGGVVTEHSHSNVNQQRHHGRHGSTTHFRDSNGHLSHALPLGNYPNGASQESSHQETVRDGYGSAVTRVTDELWAFDINANTWENITVRAEPCNKSIAMCGPLRSAGHSATLVALSDSSSHIKPTEKMIVIFGHSPQFGYLNTVQEYDFGTREWSIIQTRGYPVKGGYGHTAAFDRLTEKIYIYGGIVSESESNQILNSNLYSYDPSLRIWTLLAPAPSARFLHTANFIMPGMMIVFGGNTHNDTSHSFGAKCYSNELLSYDVLCDAWHYMTIPHDLRDNLARYGHSGTVFEGSLYLYGGFDGQMLNDMIRFTPGHCHHLTTQFDCLNSRPGIKCIWDVSKNKCINVTENLKDILKSTDPEFDLSYINCPEESRDKITQRMLSHKDRCSLQTDCTSCVQTSYNCVWCPLGICTNQRCNSNYHTSNQRKTITTLEECPVESGPVCAQLHSCIACVSASSTSQIGGQTGNTHSTASAQQNRVQDSTSVSRSGMLGTTTHVKSLYGNLAANSAHQMQCHWEYETVKCRAGNSSNAAGDNQETGNICTASCADFTSCTNCTQEECIWCQNEARCVDKNAYTASFPYGQCREWTTVISRCRIPPNLDNNVDGSLAGTGISRSSSCAAYASCSSCREDPACGWCDDGSRTGLGICLPGGAAHPTSPHTCPHHTWHFTHCPSCQCNGHSTCVENSSLCIQPCGNLTMGQHCEKCSPGFWGNPLNGGKCQPCECNDQATLCNPDSGKCYCTTKGLAGDRCDKCDATNRYHGDPTNKGFCYYDLAVDYQFTFNLSKKEDRHFTQINFRNSPTKPDIDVDFSITCSVLAKMNITIKTANGQEKTIFHSINCTTFRYRFAKADHNFGMEDNVTLTTFYVYVYDFQPPLWIQISFSQYPKLNLQQFFITFSSCFLLLLFVAAILWKCKQKYDMYRRRQRLVVEMEQMASRPFSQVLVEIELRKKAPLENHQNHVVANPLQQTEIVNNISSPLSVIVPTVRKRKKDSPSPIALEPCSGNKAAVLSLLVRLPTGGGSFTPRGHPAGLAVASALVTLGSPPRHSHAPDSRHTDTKLSKRGKGIGNQHPDTCI